MTISLMSRHELESRLIKHVLKDSAFRQEFESDPQACFEKYLKIPATSLPKIVIHHEAVGEWHIVLPINPSNSTDLSDAELENVAGGITPTVIVSGATILSAIAQSAVDGIEKHGW